MTGIINIARRLIQLKCDQFDKVYKSFLGHSESKALIVPNSDLNTNYTPVTLTRMAQQIRNEEQFGQRKWTACESVKQEMLMEKICLSVGYDDEQSRINRFLIEVTYTLCLNCIHFGLKVWNN